MLFFRNFKTAHSKAQNKMRFFGVLIISFLLHIQLFGAVTKINHKEESLALISTKVSIELYSYPNNVENTIVTDTIYQSAHVLAENSRKQFDENLTNIISSDDISQESPDIQEEDNETIFISEGTTIVGLDKIYKVKIVLETRKPEPTEFSKTSFSEQTNNTLSEIKADKKLARLVKKIQEEAKFHFSVSTGGNSKITSALDENKTAVVVPSNIVQKHALASTYTQVILKIESQLQKQKFYTSLSYLQFGKFRSSSLRGPPYAA
ncbi:hypothetical protein SAMN05421796_1223 [Chryseobacterium piscicola]|uniref:Uncharacterized protein n=1 Tax=Chryseobacterium piscicola TaxID=551459 RepID=A0A1N7PKB3_9FLAO|nr:hypothetical protein [Chryseobacterium piscicola]PQA98247.1 hypothetical protein B0A70_01310 [Chryseobacterium piscicola]SIT11006.1 hypothetical protein SAMN05421796_1223 [Chryseobacterium piscicola]